MRSCCKPPVSGLGEQRQRAEVGDPRVRVGLHGWIGRPDRRQMQLPFGGGDDRPGRPRREHLHDHPEAEGERQQITGCDRAIGRNGLVEPPVDPAQDLTVGELGEERVDGLIDVDQPLLDD